jgi:translation elongation factor EF-G
LALTIHPLANLDRIQAIDKSLPDTFAAAVNWVKFYIIEEFDLEITLQQLHYHNREHIENVQRRSTIIFDAIIPYFQVSLADVERMRLLLDLCAVAHDAIQIFIPQTTPATSRKREAGVSEILTIEKLVTYIKDLNRQLQEHDIDRSAQFSNSDLAIIQEAIEATICAYDPVDKGIYQPALYDRSKNLSLVSKILAFADIGSLGMDGIAAYNREGSLLFLEENPDIIPLIATRSITALEIDRPELSENIRQRLLSRANFQVNFAKSRMSRFPQEIADFSDEVISILTSQIFQHLNTTTIQSIESTTPTQSDGTLISLIEFFNFDDLLK